MERKLTLVDLTLELAIPVGMMALIENSEKRSGREEVDATGRDLGCFGDNR